MSRHRPPPAKRFFRWLTLVLLTAALLGRYGAGPQPFTALEPAIEVSPGDATKWATAAPGKLVKATPGFQLKDKPLRSGFVPAFPVLERDHLLTRCSAPLASAPTRPFAVAIRRRLPRLGSEEPPWHAAASLRS